MSLTFGIVYTQRCTRLRHSSGVLHLPVSISVCLPACLFVCHFICTTWVVNKRIYKCILLHCILRFSLSSSRGNWKHASACVVEDEVAFTHIPLVAANNERNATIVRMPGDWWRYFRRACVSGCKQKAASGAGQLFFCRDETKCRLVGGGCALQKMEHITCNVRTYGIQRQRVTSSTFSKALSRLVSFRSASSVSSRTRLNRLNPSYPKAKGRTAILLTALTETIRATGTHYKTLTGSQQL